jgi:hypothetical protein
MSRKKIKRPPLTEEEFTAALKDLGFKIVIGADGQEYVEGIGLKPEFAAVELEAAQREADELEDDEKH